MVTNNISLCVIVYYYFIINYKYNYKTIINIISY